MKRLISLLLCALLIIPALAEDAPDFEPISWDIKVSPNLPNPDCYLPNNGGYHDDSIDIQINVTYWMQDLQQVDAPGEGTTTVMSARVKLTDVSQFRTGFANKYPSKQARHVNDMTKRFKAVMGIDGDYCLYHEQGIVVRNGQTLRMRPHKGRDERLWTKMATFTSSPAQRRRSGTSTSPAAAPSCTPSASAPRWWWTAFRSRALMT